MWTGRVRSSGSTFRSLIGCAAISRFRHNPAQHVWSSRAGPDTLVYARAMPVSVYLETVRPRLMQRTGNVAQPWTVACRRGRRLDGVRVRGPGPRLPDPRRTAGRANGAAARVVEQPVGHDARPLAPHRRGGH